MQKATLSKRGSGLHAQYKKFKKKIRTEEQGVAAGETRTAQRPPAGAT
jgi:hypothetical protein